MEQPDWLGWAWRELGVRERAGNRNNPRISAMFKDAGHAQVDRDEIAWCAAFVGACIERSGRRSTRSLMARSYLGWGESIEEPRLGALAVLSRGADPALGHVGFVVGVTADHLQLLGGNQAQQVNVQSFPKTRLVGLRWPSAKSTETDEPAVAPSRTADSPTAARKSSDSASELGPAFEVALAHVLEMEGGYSDDPHDPGGPTNKGITIAVYAKWVGVELDDRSRTRLVQRLKRIPDAMVREIYATRYWLPASCGGMPAALALMHFDTAVNHGVGAAIRMLQQVVGTDVDGEIGPATRAAMASKPLRETLVSYAELRRDRYRALPHFWRFGKGWLRRVDTTLAAASVAMSAVQDGTKTGSTTKAGDSGMTTGNQTTRPEAKWWGESMTIWGVIVTALSTVVPVIGPVIGLDISGEMVRMLGDQVVQIAQAVGGLVGTLMAVYGRVRAEVPIQRRAVSLRL